MLGRARSQDNPRNCLVSKNRMPSLGGPVPNETGAGQPAPESGGKPGVDQRLVGIELLAARPPDPARPGGGQIPVQLPGLREVIDQAPAHARLLSDPGLGKAQPDSVIVRGFTINVWDLDADGNPVDSKIVDIEIPPP